MPQCEMDVIFTSITVCCRRGVEASPVTMTRVVRCRSLDYTRLAALDQLVLRIVRGQLAAADAYGELDTLLSSGHPYLRWVATLACAQVVGAGVVTTASVALFGFLPREVPPLPPALVLAAGLTVLLSGLSVVGAVQDAITGFYVTAAGRTFEVLLMTTGLVVGVVLALHIGARIQGDIKPPPFQSPELGDLPYQIPRPRWPRRSSRWPATPHRGRCWVPGGWPGQFHRVWCPASSLPSRCARAWAGWSVGWPGHDWPDNSTNEHAA
ncbi:MAG TPA: threonine/serine exporter family protein [Pseudonocardiaceae bacterium]|nr:threonine/serine exporter family protein [Pseudonocardiaceae bacterium]